MSYDLSLKLGEVEKIVKTEFAKYGFSEPFNKDKISTRDYPTVRESVKNIVTTCIEGEIRKIANNALKEIQLKKGEIISINENVFVKTCWFNELVILEDEFSIKIELKDQHSATEKLWTYINAKVKNEKIFYTQACDKEKHTFVGSSQNAKKAFQIILKEAKKIK